MNKSNIFNKQFLLLFIGNITSKIGTVVYNIVLAWWIVETTGSARLTGYILAASLIPIVCFSLIGGVYIDRLNKKYILMFTDIISGLVVIFIGVMAYYDFINVPLLIISNFILGSCSCLFKPSLKSIIPEIIEKEHLVKVNSIITSVSQAAKVIGPIIGALFISIKYIGVSGTFIINGITFIISAICEFFIHYKHTYIEGNKTSIIKDIKKGLTYIYDKKGIWNILVIISVANVFLSSFIVLIPLFVKNVLMESSQYYSYVMAVFSMGGVCVILVHIILKEISCNQITLAISIALTGIILALISVMSGTIVFLPCIFLFGFLVNLFNTMFYSYIQASVDKEYLGRTFATTYLIASIMTPLSYVIFGYLGDFFIDTIFLYTGIAVFVCTLPLIFTRNYKREKGNKL